MIRRALLALTVLGVGAAARGQNFDLAAIDQEVQTALKTWQVPGTAIVIVQPNRVRFLKGYGRRELDKDSPVTGNTIFPLASCTKAFTTVALAMLVDEGKLAWDDPVRKHLPDFHLSDPHADALVTVRDLLSHRTGVGGHDLLWYRAPWSQDESIRRIGNVPLDGQFRGSFAYQSIMFMAAGKIVGNHHAKSWEGFVRERIFEPIGLTTTCTTSTEAATKLDVAHGHRRDREGRIAAIDGYPMPAPNPSGTIHTTARDLGRWLQFHLGDGSWNGKRLVSAANLDETHRPQNLIPSNDITRAMNPDTVQLTYAMGWVVQDYRGVKLVAHAGLIDGFRCQLTLLPQHGIGIGLLNNLHETRMNLALTNRLIDLLLEMPEKDWHGYFGQLEQAEKRAKEENRRQREQRRKKGEKPTLALANYAGDYEHPAYGLARVQLDGNRLVWEWSSFKRDLLPFERDTFEIRDVVADEQDVTFTIESGRAVRMKCLDVEFVRKRN